MMETDVTLERCEICGIQFQHRFGKKHCARCRMNKGKIKKQHLSPATNGMRFYRDSLYRRSGSSAGEKGNIYSYDRDRRRNKK